MIGERARRSHEQLERGRVRFGPLAGSSTVRTRRRIGTRRPRPLRAASSAIRSMPETPESRSERCSAKRLAARARARARDRGARRTAAPVDRALARSSRTRHKLAKCAASASSSPGDSPSRCAEENARESSDSSFRRVRSCAGRDRTTARRWPFFESGVPTSRARALSRRAMRDMTVPSGTDSTAAISA